MFDKKGQIIIDKEECEMDADDLMMLALDAGAEDFADEEDSYEVIYRIRMTSPQSARRWRKAGVADGGGRRYHDPADLGRADRSAGIHQKDLQPNNPGSAG